MTERCSIASRAAGIPLAGSAPHVTEWLVVEQRIPFAARALESERLDPRMRELLSAQQATVLLARHSNAAGPERFWYADATSSTFGTGLASDLLDALDRGATPPTIVSAAPADPVLFVCANGKRDMCCAIESRPLLDEIGTRDDVWQCTHLGGHRFAPTALLLPTGMVYGRLSARVAVEALEGARRGEAVVAQARGNSSLGAIAQVADIHVRQRFEVAGPRELQFEVSGAESAQPVVDVHCTDGRVWQVVLQRRRSIPVPEACGRELLPESYWSLESIAVVR